MNQPVAVVLRGIVNSVVCRFAPDEGVNRKTACVTSRGVEKPVVVTSNPLAVRVTVTDLVAGAARRTRIVRGAVTSGTGVEPLANEVVKTIVPANVPV